MNPATWSATAAIGSAFLASLVEAVEAFTVVLAAATLRGWRPAATGAAAAVGTLTALIAGFGPLLAAMPVKALQFAIGVLLLLFGMGWLRKAILRAAEALPLHDEAAIFVTETARVTAAMDRRRRSRDWIAGLTAFKAVLLEGLEVVFIVLAFGAGGRLLWPAACGALAACLLMLAAGVAIRRPLAAVPENALKYSVGVLLSAFGVFWTGEGLGIAWPGGDLAVPVVAGAFLLAGLATASLLRHSVETSSMSIVNDIAKELAGMFIADARLTIAILVLIAGVAGLRAAGVGPWLAGASLLIGCLAILIDAAHRGARRQRAIR